MIPITNCQRHTFRHTPNPILILLFIAMLNLVILGQGKKSRTD